MNSCWFQLYIYHLLSVGPASIVFAKGTRVQQIPEFLRNLDTVTMCTWNKEPAIIHLTNLLPILNEHLLDAPVMIQEFAPFGIDVSVVEVPFPFDSIESSEQTESKEKKNLHFIQGF